MKTWIVLKVLAGLCAPVFAVFGLVAVLIGFAEQHAADKTYVVGFALPGDECGPGAVDFDISDGQVLKCMSNGMRPLSSTARFPGFTDAQNQEMTALASQYGESGLSTPERREIQWRANQLAKTVPEERRPHYDEGVSLGPLWGASLAWVGIGVLFVSILAFIAFLRRDATDVAR